MFAGGSGISNTPWTGFGMALLCFCTAVLVADVLARDQALGSYISKLARVSPSIENWSHVGLKP